MCLILQLYFFHSKKGTSRKFKELRILCLVCLEQCWFPQFIPFCYIYHIYFKDDGKTKEAQELHCKIILKTCVIFILGLKPCYSKSEAITLDKVREIANEISTFLKEPVAKNTEIIIATKLQKALSNQIDRAKVIFCLFIPLG